LVHIFKTQLAIKWPFSFLPYPTSAFALPGKKQNKLEIWGIAQRESARRPKSDWGKLGGVVKFPRHQSHVARTQMHWYTPNAHCRLRVGQHERL